MDRKILGVYNTRFGYQLVQITNVVSYSSEDSDIRYTTINLITGQEKDYYGYELWERQLDEDEYLADITCSLENKDFYIEGK